MQCANHSGAQVVVTCNCEPFYGASPFINPGDAIQNTFPNMLLHQPSGSRIMPLLNCPNELLLLIAEGLVPHAKDLKNFLSANRRLHSLLLGRLHRLAVEPTDDEPVLHWAIRRDNTSLLLLLLEHGADPNARELRTGLGRTALHIAATHGATAMIKPLLSQGRASIDLQDHDGRTALARAILAHHFTAAQTLLECGAAASIPDKQDTTPLHWAVYATRKTSTATEQLIAQLASRGAAALDHPDRNGTTPLYLALSRRHARVVRLLLGLGADLFAARARGLKALRTAVVGGDVELVELLLEQRGADVNYRDGNGKTLLHLAAAVTVTVGWSMEPMIRMLIAKGASVSVVDECGARPLLFARHAPEGVRRLLEC